MQKYRHKLVYTVWYHLNEIQNPGKGGDEVRILVTFEVDF